MYYKGQEITNYDEYIAKQKQDSEKTTEIPALTIIEDPIEIERKKHYVRGLSGLKNLGNTCYMNSILQCLSSIDIFRTYLVEGKYFERLHDATLNRIDIEIRKKHNIPENETTQIKTTTVNKVACNTIVNRLAELLKTMWKQNATVEPRKFKKVTGENCSLFNGSSQNDSQELLNLILDRIHEETKSNSIKITFKNISEETQNYLSVKTQCIEKANDDQTSVDDKEKYLKYLKDYTKTHIADSIIGEAYLYLKKFIKPAHSIITDLFTGLYYSQITCQECKSITGSFEPFTMISLETKEDGETTLKESLDSFVKEELLTDDNKYYCSECNIKVNAIKKMHIWSPPNILIIQLKRFTNDNWRTTKTTSKIIFPIENLDLKDYTSQLNNVTNTKYDLVAISEHRGSCNFGHYVAYARNSINNEWYEFNDDDVFRVPYDDLAKEIITKNAYILFYVRQLN